MGKGIMSEARTTKKGIIKEKRIKEKRIKEKVKKPEEGMVLVIVLLIMIIILALLSSLAAVMGIEVRLSSFNLNEIRAGYFAEAGLAEALNLVRNKIKAGEWITSVELQAVSGYDAENGYQITAVSLPADPESEGAALQITSCGLAAGISREIGVDITLEEEIRTLNAGGEISRVLTEAGNSWETAVEGDSYREELGEGIPRITAAQFDEYVDSHPEAEAVVYQAEAGGEGYVLHLNPEELEGIDAGLIYIKGDLLLADTAGESVHTIEGGSSPLLILVSGDVVIEDTAGMEGIIVICLGNFSYEQPVSNIELNNVFIYALGMVDFNRSEQYYPGFHLSGKVISGEGISLLTKGGQVEQTGYSITLPAEFACLNKVRRPHINSWLE